MKNFILPLTGLSLFSTGCAQKQEQKTPEMPNVVYVFPDQYRNMAMGFWNEPEFNKNVNFKADPVHTPNINKFAKESLVLSNAMSNCTYRNVSKRKWSSLEL